jgi:hypothetical protein
MSLNKPKYNSRLHRCPGTTKNGIQCGRWLKCNHEYCKYHKYQSSLWAKDKPDVCPICCDKFTNSNVPLSCGHWVHLNCVIKWGEDICPICKEKLILDKKTKKKIEQKKKQRKEVSDNELLNELGFAIQDAIEMGNEAFIFEIETEQGSEQAEIPPEEALGPLITFFTNVMQNLFEEEDDEGDENREMRSHSV